MKARVVSLLHLAILCMRVCVFILIYRRAWTTFAASVLFHLCLSSLLPRHGDIWTIWEIIVGLQSAVDLSEHAIN